MGNITNLATTGNYATEANGLKVSFNFVIDNETKELTISDGKVTEPTSDENERVTTLATFNKRDLGSEIKNSLSFRVAKGREVELVTIITDAISALETEIVAGTVIE